MRLASMCMLTTSLILILSACADRREAIAREHLQNQIATDSNAAFTLSSFAKTNGYDQDRDGMNLYVLEWEAQLHVQNGGWKAGWRDFHMLPSEPNRLEAAVMGVSPQRLRKGATVTLSGKSSMQKADRGWRVLDISPTSAKVVPPPAVPIQVALLGKWSSNNGADLIEISQRGAQFNVLYKDQYAPSPAPEILCSLVDGRLVGDYYGHTANFTISLVDEDHLSLSVDPFAEFAPIRNQMFVRTN